MKNRLFVFVILILVVLVGLLIVTSLLQTTPEKSISNTKRDDNNIKTTVIKTPAIKISKKAQRVEDPKTQSLINKARTLMLSRNRPLEVYGKVIDQYNQPIRNAEITYTIIYYDGIVRTGYGSVVETHKVYSDNVGRFAILNQSGFKINVKMISKEGYEFTKIPIESNTNSNKYGYLKGTEIPNEVTTNTPVVFKGWRIEDAPNTYFQRKRVVYGFKPGQVYTIDFLKKGKKYKGEIDGDLRVLVERSDGMEKDKPSWRARIEALGGGLVETSDTYMYQAPEHGYRSVWEFGHKNTDRNYKAGKAVSFYLKSRGGNVHARINMEIIPFYDEDAVIYTDYFVNPTGSRSLYAPENKPGQ